MRPGIRSTFTLFAASAMIVALAGCGSDGSTTADDPSDGSSSPAASDSPSAAVSDPATASATPSLPSVDDPTEAIVLPACDTVWVEGQKLPSNYQGCLEGAKTIEADGLYCEFGKPIFTYGKRYYAVENGPVNRTAKPLAKDKVFQSAQRKCGG